MVKVAAPMLSLDASGSLAGALVFSKWKGRNYVRVLVKPANPKAVKQLSVRAMFKFLSQEWTNSPTAEKATWNDLAEDKVISPFNAYMSHGQARWRQGLTPCRYLPIANLTGWGNINWTSTTGGVRMATHVFGRVAPQDHFGILIARSVTTGFTPGFENLVQVYNAAVGATHTIVDTPLAAGTYYYRFLLFEEGGRQAAAWMPEKSAVVTDV